MLVELDPRPLAERFDELRLTTRLAEKRDERFVSVRSLRVEIERRPQPGFGGGRIAEPVAIPACRADLKVAQCGAVERANLRDALDHAAERLPRARCAREPLDVAEKDFVPRIELERPTQRRERTIEVLELALPDRRDLGQEPDSLAVRARETNANVVETRDLLHRARLPVHVVERVDDLERQLFVLRQALHRLERDGALRVAVENLLVGVERAAKIAEVLLAQRAEPRQELVPFGRLGGDADAPVEHVAELVPALRLGVEPIERLEQLGLVADLLRRARVRFDRARRALEILLRDPRQTNVEPAGDGWVERRGRTGGEHVRDALPCTHARTDPLELVRGLYVPRVLG